MTERKKDISKLPATKLREIALKIPGIEGVHGMSKQQLIEAIKAAQGITEEGTKREEIRQEISRLKKEIRELKVERDKAIAEKDKVRLREIRKKIKKLKRRTRLLAAAK